MQSGIYPPSQKVPLLIHDGSMQLGTLQVSLILSKQQGRLPTPPIHLNLSGKEQSGTSPGIQKLPLLVQRGIIQFGVLLSKVTLLMQTGILEEEPIHLKSSLVLQSGTKPFEQNVPVEQSGTTIKPEVVVDVVDVELPVGAEQTKVISGLQLSEIPLLLQHSIG